MFCLKLLKWNDLLLLLFFCIIIYQSNLLWIRLVTVWLYEMQFNTKEPFYSFHTYTSFHEPCIWLNLKRINYISYKNRSKLVMYAYDKNWNFNIVPVKIDVGANQFTSFYFTCFSIQKICILLKLITLLFEIFISLLLV